MPRGEPIRRDANLFELGMDSLMSVEFLYRVNRGLGANLPMERLLAHPAIEPLAEQLVAELGLDDAGRRSVERPLDPQPAAAKTVEKDPWFPALLPAPNARVRLFCFHPPGGSASVYSNWPLLAGPETEIWAMQLPGSGERQAEPHVEPWQSLVEMAANQILEHLDRPFAFFGYGSASLLALDAAHSVRERFGLTPVHLFVAAAWAPQDVAAQVANSAGSLEPWAAPSLAGLADAGETTRQAGPPDGGESEGFRAYGFQFKPPLDCPVTAFFADGDDRFGREQLARWSGAGDGGFRLERMPGPLAALLQSPEALLRVVAEDLRGALER